MQTFRWIKDTLQFNSWGIFVRIVWRFFGIFWQLFHVVSIQKDSWRSAIKIKGFPCGYWASIYLQLSSYCNPPPPSLPWWVEQGGCLFGRFKPPQSLTSCLLTLSAAADLSKAAAMPAAPNNEQSKNPDFVQNLLFFLFPTPFKNTVRLHCFYFFLLGIKDDNK